MLKKQQYNQLKEMGFSNQAIQKAAKIAKQSNRDIYDVLIQPVQSQSQISKQSTNNFLAPSAKTFMKSKDQFQVDQYECIYKENQDSLEFEREDRRDQGIPVGLKNISNCCYLNSLLQAYFLMPRIVQTILQAVPLQKQQLDQVVVNTIRNKRISNSYNLLRKMQQLYSNMILSTKKYLDPSDILKNLVDSLGNKISYGEEKDLSEINLQLISRLQECATYVQSNFPFLKNHMNESPEKQQYSSTVNQLKSPLKEMLFGEKVQFSNNLNETKIESQFFGILLNPAHGSLYKSLDEQFHYTIEHEDGKIKKDVWITKQPDYLFFYIQRTNYDKKKGVIKIKDKIKFDFEIYLDRYLLKNKDKQIDKNPVLIENISNRDKTIKQINHTKLLLKALIACHHHNSFLTNSPIKLPQKEPLLEYLEQLEDNLDAYEQNISRLESRQDKYYLRYIIVHRGEADSGHYWGYGYSESWWRYDINNVKVDKQQMIKEIQNGDVVVYALVYSKIQQKIFPDFGFCLKDDGYNFFNEPTNYNYMVPPKFRQKIIKENQNREKIYQSKRLVESISEITLQYEQRIKKINDFIAIYRASNTKYPIITNFSLYLRSLSESPSNLFKFNILDISIRHLTKFNINEMPNENYLKQLETSFRQNLPKSLLLDKFKMTKLQATSLKEKFEDFKKNYKAFYGIMDMFHQINENKFEEATLAAIYVIRLNTKNYFLQVARQFLAVLLLQKIYVGQSINKQLLSQYEKDVKYYNQVMQIAKIDNAPLNTHKSLKLNQMAEKDFNNKQFYMWAPDHKLNELTGQKIGQEIKRISKTVSLFILGYRNILKSQKALTQLQIFA